MADWPIFEMKDTLFHVGTMDPATKGTGSQEGHGLSVSRDPDDWRYIAKLPGTEWVLEKPGHKLLDVHSLPDELRDVIMDWAVEKGFLEPITIFEAVQWDSEFEREMSSVHATYEDALKELPILQRGDQWVWDNIDETPLEQGEFDDMIRERDGHAATPALMEMMKAGSCPAMGCQAEDYAIIAYAEQVLGVDGCWWEDDYDPDTLSCPRGVILPEKVASWKVIPAEEYEPEDEFPQP